jgi:hypothetical protein
MEIIDSKSLEVGAFLNSLAEMLDGIEALIKSRSPHLNGEKFLTNKEVCRMLQVSARTLQTW